MKHIRWVLDTAINACRAFLMPYYSGHWKSAKAVRKSMKTHIYLDLKFWALKSLAKKTAQKLSKENAHFPYGHSMSASRLRKSMKSRISNDFATWALKSLKNFFVKKLSTVNSTTAAWTDHQRIPKFLKIRNDQKLTFIKISHNDCWNHWRFFQWKSYPQPVQFALL